LLCWEDTIETQGYYEGDTLGLLNYLWNFGNGQKSNERNAIVMYTQPGTYLVTLIVSDSLGWSDTLQQYIVKPQPCTSPRKAALIQNGYAPSWDVFPNPANTNLTLTFDTSWSSAILVELYTLEGKCMIKQFVSSSEKEELPMAQLSPGLYLLHVTDDKRSEFKKIIIKH